MASKKFYGVKDHPDASKNGVYDTWDACSAAVKGASGVKYKGFPSRAEAESFVGTPEAAKSAVVEKPVENVENRLFGGDVKKMEEARTMLAYLQANGVLTQQEAERGLDRIDGITHLPGTPGSLRNVPGAPSVAADHVAVYVDGSYNASKKLCGYGVYIQGAGKVVPGRSGRPEFMMCGGVPENAGGRNIEGEVTAAWLGIEAAARMTKPGTPIVVYHDYEGIGGWGDKAWARNRDYTVAYAEKIASMRAKGINVRFQHVPGHTGNEGNEMVDQLAKLGCDVPVSASFMDTVGRPFVAAGAVPSSGLVHDLDVPVHLAGSTRAVPDVSGLQMREMPDGQMAF